MTRPPEFLAKGLLKLNVPSSRQSHEVVHSPANISLRGCKLGEFAVLLSLKGKTAALSKILPYTTSQMFWCRDCPLGTALLASVLHFRSKKHNITR